MNRNSLVTLVLAIGILIIAFSPPVMAEAEQSDNVHFGQHILVLLAGLLLARTFYALVGHVLTRDADRARRGVGIAGIGLVLFLATMVPAVDVLADQSEPIHMLVHLLILAAGGLIGTGFLSLASEPSNKLSVR